MEQSNKAACGEYEEELVVKGGSSRVTVGDDITAIKAGGMPYFWVFSEFSVFWNYFSGLSFFRFLDYGH